MEQGETLSMINYSFNACSAIARFMPESVSSLVTAYLVLILPFRTIICDSDPSLATGPASPFLFATRGKVWDTKKYSAILIRCCRLLEIPQLEMSSWRQIAIGIAKKHLSNRGLLLDLDEEEDEALLNVDEALHRQASHSSTTGEMRYFQPLNFENSLKETMLSEFRKVSINWHELFGFVTRPQQATRESAAPPAPVPREHNSERYSEALQILSRISR